MRQLPSLFDLWALSLAMLMAGVLAAEAKDSAGVTGAMVVKAPPHIVYDTIVAIRKSKACAVKVVSHGTNQSVVEEKFAGLPFIKEATCSYVVKFTPGERIEYRMLNSDRFKAFQGAWVLKPTNNGMHTVVELSSYVDTGISVPIARFITDHIARRDINKRLTQVKKSAELAMIDINGRRIATER